MKKSTRGPVWKKGMTARQDYVPPQELEAPLTDEQKKWPVVDGWGVPPEKLDSPPPDAQTAEPQPKTPPAA